MKGVSDTDAQNNKKKEGSKNEAKKPIQVLHIIKKDKKKEREEISDNNKILLNKVKFEPKTVKPQSFEDREIVPLNPLCSGEKPKY